MLETIMKSFDPYDRKARLYPALLALLPVFVTLSCRYGGKLTLLSSLVSTLVACGTLFWIARIARNAGVRVQEKMWRPWGGTPTIRYLRHSDLSIDPITKERYHSVLAHGIGKDFPSASEEKANPDVADQLYRSGIKWLMEQTRDQEKYAHLLKENIAYGFHRNMRGLRPLALGIAFICLIASLLWAGLFITEQPYVRYSAFSSWNIEQSAAVLVPVASLILWLFFVTEKSVEQASSAYSERLLQACEGMLTGVKKKSPKSKGERNAT